jgi:hypothetical protein
MQRNLQPGSCHLFVTKFRGGSFSLPDSAGFAEKKFRPSRNFVSEEAL